MADSAISNLLRKNVGAGLARVSLNKNIIRNYFSLVFSVDKRAFKRRVWFDFNVIECFATVLPPRCCLMKFAAAHWSRTCLKTRASSAVCPSASVTSTIVGKSCVVQRLIWSVCDR